jgi:holliday junction DNA helicase RuvA
VIGRLTGRIELDETGQVLVDVSGVGYLVRAPASTTRLLKPGETASLRVHTVFSQEQLTLYGFATSEELRIFQLLTKVDRVGPKLALAILGALGAPGLVRALVTDDIRALSSVPGVGKKTAQRLLLELREKLTDVGSLVESPAPMAAAGPPDARTDALEALVALGYGRAQAAGTVEALWRAGGSEQSTPDLIRGALLHFSRPL